MFSLFTNLCKEKYGDKVIIVDSLSVCSFMGNLVRYAVKLNNEGFEPKKIVELVQKRVGTEVVRFVPETMVYLKRGGRIPPAVAAIGGLLGIKPVLKLSTNGIEKEGITIDGTEYHTQYDLPGGQKIIANTPANSPTYDTTNTTVKNFGLTAQIILN